MNIAPPCNAADLLTELDRLGIQLEADRDRLRFRPREKVTAYLADRMKAHKAELLSLVAKRQSVNQRIAEQLAQLVPYRTPDRRQGWINPQYQEELARSGLL